MTSTIVRDESGSILLMTLVLLIILLAFSGLVIDQGLLFVGRSQAQAAADSGALAGAVALAFDHDDRSATGPAKTSAYRFARANAIVGEPPDVKDPAMGDFTDVKFYSDHPEDFPEECRDNDCVRVDVYRNQTRGNPLPVLVTTLIGVEHQGVRATATARARPANVSTCLKPWLIPDKFADVNSNGRFDVGIDAYATPGWTTADIGTTLTLSPGHPADAIAPSDFYQLTSGTDYPDAILGCTLKGTIGETVEVFPGLSGGLTRHNVEELIARNDGEPVTVLVGMFDPAAFAAQDRTSGKYELAIVNMMGFRISGMDGPTLLGTIVTGPGEIDDDRDAFGGGLVKAVQLIR